MNYTLITIFIGIVSLHCSKAAKVTETSCTKDTANQCEHTQNAECDNAETDSKCKCSDGFAEDRTDGSTCVKTVSGTTCKTNECDSILNSHCDTDSCKCNDGFVMNVEVCDADTTGKVTDTGCTKDGTDQCKHTPNAKCDNAVTGAKCKCSDGYSEDKTDGKTCVKTVSGTTCNANGNECDSILNSHCDTDSCKCNDGFVINVEVCDADTTGKVTETGCTKDGTDQCKHTPNAECDNAETGAKCKCSDGYAEDKPDGRTCLKILGGTCAADGDCTKAGEAVCTDKQCSCKADFGEKDNKCVKTVSGTTCSESGKECDKIDNSHCHTDKCRCDAGYVMNVDACTAEKSAASIQLGTLMVLLSGLAILIQQF